MVSLKLVWALFFLLSLMHSVRSAVSVDNGQLPQQADELIDQKTNDYRTKRLPCVIGTRHRSRRCGKRQIFEKQVRERVLITNLKLVYFVKILKGRNQDKT